MFVLVSLCVINICHHIHLYLRMTTFDTQMNQGSRIPKLANTQSRNLPFLVFGRIRDTCIIGQVGEKTEATGKIFRKLLEASATKLAPGKRLRLQWDQGSVCCQLDERGDILY